MAGPSEAGWGSYNPGAATVTFEKAFYDWNNKNGDYRKFMEEKARNFEDFLAERCPSTAWRLTCPICEKPMPRGVGDHFPSRDHAYKLREKLQWTCPSADVAKQWAEEWILSVPDGGRTIQFNMLTGDFAEQCDGGVAATNERHTVRGGDDEVPTCPAQQFAAPQAVQCASPREVPDWRTAAEDWKNKSGKWRARMEPMAQELENLLKKHCPQACWTLNCNLCNSPLRTDHIPGKAHCAKLQGQMEWKMPPDDIVRELHRPWIWKTPCESPVGAFVCFNHLTGESCLEEGDRGSQPAQQQQQQQQPQAAVPVQANMQPPAVVVPAPQLAPTAQVSLYPPINKVPELGYAEAFEDWGNKNGKFRRFYEPKCQALQALMTQHGVQIPDTCMVCSSHMLSLENHLPSTAHAKKVQELMKWKLPPPDIAVEEGRPWVWKYPCRSGVLTYNLLTGEAKVSQTQDGSGATAAPTSVVTPAPVAQQQTLTTQVPQPVCIPVSAAASQDQTYRAAFEDWNNKKGLWRQFMEPLAKDFEEALCDCLGDAAWEQKCAVCDTVMTRGVAEHMPSKKHCSNFQGKLNWSLPPPGVAEDMDMQPWVMSFTRRKPPNGVLKFNLLTGKHVTIQQGATHQELPQPQPQPLQPQQPTTEQLPQPQEQPQQPTTEQLPQPQQQPQSLQPQQQTTEQLPQPQEQPQQPRTEQLPQPQEKQPQPLQPQQPTTEQLPRPQEQPQPLQPQQPVAAPPGLSHPDEDDDDDELPSWATPAEKAPCQTEFFNLVESDAEDSKAPAEEKATVETEENEVLRGAATTTTGSSWTQAAQAAEDKVVGRSPEQAAPEWTATVQAESEKKKEESEDEDEVPSWAC